MDLIFSILLQALKINNNTMNKERMIDILNLVVESLESVSEEKVIVLGGICSVISRLFHLELISREEKEFMRAFVMDHKPDDKYLPEYTNNKYWTGQTFWWTPVSEERCTAIIRIAFVKELIKIIDGES